MTDSNDLLPIKLIFPEDGDYRRPQGGGGDKKDFLELYDYDDSRDNILSGLESVTSHFDNAFSLSNLPAVARVVLQDEAVAKSHLPTSLFTKHTCPIIGAEDIGELLVSVQPKTLRRLTNAVSGKTGDKIKQDVAKIQFIEPYSQDEALGGWSIETLVSYLRKKHIKELKLRLFNHREKGLDKLLSQALYELSKESGLQEVSMLNYGPALHIFSIPIEDHVDQINQFADFIGTQSLDVFDEFTISEQASPVSSLQQDDLPPPESGVEYPLVGIIDSGTDPNNEHLQAWVETRDETLVPAIDQDNTHGSLVAGLLANSRKLNHDHPEFPTGKAKIIDVVAIPGSGQIKEQDLLEALRHAFSNHPEATIWNMSLNSGNLCRHEGFSDFGIALDAIQDDYNVLVINSAGNYNVTPAHAWRRPDLADKDRILAPADSLRAITVGSIAHIHQPDACAKIGEPSPFSRKGPGAAYVPKPDVCHFGGNANRNLHYNQMGILSVDAQNNIAETVGTSFAAPLVAVTAAELAASLEQPPSRNLIKAFIIHSAVLNSPEITKDDLPYTGFGKPPAVADMLRCNPWEATLVFDLNLPFTNRKFHKTYFPIPPCLHNNGKAFGEVVMTLVYDPPLDPYEGASYSQVNINASLGVCYIKDGKEDKYDRRIIPYPKDYRDMFEKNQIEHGFKWSPVKVYRKKMTSIDSRDAWRITLETQARRTTAPSHQSAVLIATIRDPEEERPVYNEVVGMLNRVGWANQNLAVRDSVRIRATN